MLIGSHVSIAGGLREAPLRAADLGCESFQIFTKSQLQWKAKPLESDEVLAWFETLHETGTPPCFVHDSYLINLCSPDEPLRRKSVDALVDEVIRAALLGIPWVNIHPGSHMGAGEEAGLANCTRSLREALQRTEGSGTGILLETTAGQGRDIGSRFEHLARLLEAQNDPLRMGVCVDTCHCFAAGYNFTTDEGYSKTWNRFRELIGLDYLRAFHLNDSKFPLGSRRDRHAEIGTGHIGREGFRRLLADPRFAGLPGVCELPNEKGETIRSLRLSKYLRG